ncbi:MAG: hypothetical protein HUK08_04510 [Bacteroidaceae bacterium]|nr:hypothetical protein [Bacteroidaceae bacterium]
MSGNRLFYAVQPLQRRGGLTGVLFDKCLPFVLLLVMFVLLPSTVCAQKYVPTEEAKQKAALKAARRGEKSSEKLVYKEPKKNIIQKLKEDSASWTNAVQVNLDLAGPISSLFSSKKYFEASARLSMKDRIFPAIEVGYGFTNYHDDVKNTNYKTGALYGKVGVDFNLLKNKHDIYQFFLGFRFAGTSFKYDLSAPEAVDPVWGGNANYAITDAKCTYWWVEFLGGVDIRVTGPLHLGWTFRYKKKLSSSYDGIDKAWYVPGYGTDDDSGFGATFSVGIEVFNMNNRKKQGRGSREGTE